jgi:chorismate synthase
MGAKNMLETNGNGGFLSGMLAGHQNVNNFAMRALGRCVDCGAKFGRLDYVPLE